jgi:hypothetical protein
MSRIGKGLLAAIVGCAFFSASLFVIKSKAMSQPSTWPASNVAAEYQSRVVVALDGPVMLSGGSARVTLAAATGANGQTLAARIAALAPGMHLYLLLKDLSVKEQPGTLYRIYVDLPADAKPVRDDPHYAGMLNFYNAGTSGDLRPPNTGNQSFLRYDITTLLKNLKAQNLLCDETTITIMPTTNPADDSDPRIGRIEIVEQ